MTLKIKTLGINIVTAILLALGSPNLMALTLDQVGEFSKFTPVNFTQLRTEFGQSTLTPTLTPLATILSGHTARLANVGSAADFVAARTAASTAQSYGGGNGHVVNATTGVNITDGDTIAGRERALLTLIFNYLSTTTAYTSSNAQIVFPLVNRMGQPVISGGPSILATPSTTMTANNISFADVAKYIMNIQVF